MNKITPFLLILFSITASAQIPVGVIAVSANYKGNATPYSPMWDNDQNTAIDNKQVIGIAGNSKARGTTPTVNDYGPYPYYQNTVYQYNSSTLTALNSSDISGAVSGSFVMKFGIDYYKETGYKPVFIPKGSGGSTVKSISGNNDWSTTGSLYTPFVNATNAACTAIGTSYPRMTIWDVLVNDARHWRDGTSGFNLTNIETAFRSLLTRLTTDFPNTPHYFIIPGREEEGVTTEITQVAAMAIDAISEYAKCYVILDEGDYLTKIYAADALHYSKYGNIFVGAMTCKNMKTIGHLSATPITYSYNAAALSSFARLTDPSTPEKHALNDFLGYLSDNGYLSQIVSMYCFALSTQTNASQDLLRSVTATFNSVTHDPYGGVTTSGSTSSYINTSFNPSTDGGGVYTLNSASMGFYLVANNQASNTLSTLVGAVGATSGANVSITQGGSNGIIYRHHSSTGGTYGTGRPKAYSFYNTIRLSSTNNILNEDGSGSSSSAATSALPNQNIYIGTRNNNGTRDLPYAGKFGFFYVSSSSTINRFIIGSKVMELMIDLELNEPFAYVAIPDAPTFTNTHTLVQATTGTGLQSGDLNGKTSFYAGNYTFAQFNVVNSDDYKMMSLVYDEPANWSIMGSPSPNDYSLDNINASHGISLYRLRFEGSDNLIKWNGTDTTLTLKQIYIENCIFRNAGFGSIIINQNIAGDGYGKFTSKFNSFTGDGSERHYLGKTGTSVQKYMDTTRISHCYMDSSKREAVQCNNHKYVMVENITSRHGGQPESPDQGIGQKNIAQFQGVGAGYFRNSIGESVAPMMIASTGLDIINNRLTWTQTNRPIYFQDVTENGYHYKNVGDDTVRIEGNDFICDGYSLTYVLYLQEKNCHYVIKNNRFPASATSIYRVDGDPPLSITLSGNTFDSDDVPPVTFGNPPENEYVGWHYVVTSDYDYYKGRGMRTP